MIVFFLLIMHFLLDKLIQILIVYSRIISCKQNKTSAAFQNQKSEFWMFYLEWVALISLHVSAKFQHSSIHLVYHDQTSGPLHHQEYLVSYNTPVSAQHSQHWGKSHSLWQGGNSRENHGENRGVDWRSPLYKIIRSGVWTWRIVAT